MRIITLSDAVLFSKLCHRVILQTNELYFTDTNDVKVRYEHVIREIFQRMTIRYSELCTILMFISMLKQNKPGTAYVDVPFKAREQKYFQVSRILFSIRSQFQCTKKPEGPFGLNRTFCF